MKKLRAVGFALAKFKRPDAFRLAAGQRHD